MQKFKQHLSVWLFAGAATLFVGLAYTASDFFTAPTHALTDRLILFSQWLAILIGIFPVFYLLSINKYVFASIYPLVCVLSGVLTYFRYTTGTIFTTMIFDAALDNDHKITQELISVWLILTMIASLLAGVGFAVYRFRKLPVVPLPALHVVWAVALTIVVFQLPRIGRPMTERVPMNLYFIPQRYFAEKKTARSYREPLPGKVTAPVDKPLVVLILGESLRADHLELNGYARNTTPLLATESVVSFPNIYSPYTYTNPSIAHIMTRADSLAPERADSERSFVDLFKRCGFPTVWLGNQEPAKTYVYFMEECDRLIYGNINKSYYVFDHWTDELLLPPLDTVLPDMTDGGLVIMHTIGSHWYYNAHYTDEFRRFVPETKSRIVTANTSEEMINSYDNTVVFTDYFISCIINRLRDRKTLMIYLSDHGEALGEDGLWLHANTVDAAHNPACIVWLSDAYREAKPGMYERLLQNRNKRYHTDFLFHTILDGAGIEADILQNSQSLFASE
ncbi:phosphoethanolamine transferase [Tannerella forsythia]|uniref:phosphoethanolamine transferase n=1 Tax=Tannerella forsythia TaxID=28112 RepID=UPI0028EA35CA|nr:phosphoethanolamine transferase [Tannerella forsythia]